VELLSPSSFPLAARAGPFLLPQGEKEIGAQTFAHFSLSSLDPGIRFFLTAIGLATSTNIFATAQTLD